MARKGLSRKKLDWIVSVIVIATVALLITVSKGGDGSLISGLAHLKDRIVSELWDDNPTLLDINESTAGNVDTSGNVKVHFIDVGQGKCILIEAPEKKVLIDAGENNQGETVLRYLAKQSIKSLDIVIGTHPHSDHIGGLDTVLLAMPVDKIILPVVSDELSPTTPTYVDLLNAIASKGLKITPSRSGDEYDLGGGASLRILGPVRDDYADLNDFSVVSRLDYGSASFLFTGDLTSVGEKDLLDANTRLRATVLDVGHHGSASSSSKSFLEAVRPRIAVISCGVDNPYGHPNRQITQRLGEVGNVEILRTDLDNSIIISSDGKNLIHETNK